MKEIVLITAYCDDDIKKQILINCITHLKEMNLNICISSHYPLDIEVQESVNYCIYDKSNPVIYNGSKNITIWRWYVTANRMLNFRTPDYSYAVINLWKNGLSFLKNIGYEKIYIINYDVDLEKSFVDDCSKILDEYDLGILYLPFKNSVYKDLDEILITCLPIKFTAIDEFIAELSFDKYMSCQNAMLEQFMGLSVIPNLEKKVKIKSIMPVDYNEKIQGGCISVTSDYFNNFDRYDDDEVWYSLFVGKNVDSGFVEILIYEIFKKIDEIKIILNGEEYNANNIISKFFILSTSIINENFNFLNLKILINNKDILNEMDLDTFKKLDTTIYYKKHE